MHQTPTPQALRLLEQAEQLQTVIDRSHERPVVIFKHSPLCGTSAQAYDELQLLIEDGHEAELYLVDVLRHRAASQAVSARFGIRHESPQVLVLREGQVGWHGSHYRVTADAIREALENADRSI
jgi:bacillithiol system protein YtxJ